MRYSIKYLNKQSLVSAIQAIKVIAMSSLLCLMTLQVSAVTGRHPTGINVNANGVSTVLITYHNLEANEKAVDAFWCGEVTSSGVVVGTNPCVAGTLLGHLPQQFDFASRSQNAQNLTGCQFPLDSGLCPTQLSSFISAGQNINKKQAASNNLTDVMSIPIAVIRRAYQEAGRGNSSEFFYVRKFVNNGINTYVTVTCRMAGGGARTPLALTQVDLDFNGEGYRQAITLVKQNQPLPNFSAHIKFNGSGLLKGRWEIVRPGDGEPSRFDLLSQASLPPESRPLQKRYRLISRFQKFLSPTGTTIIPGPDPKFMPTLEKGLYQILLRIEASNDKEGNSNTTSGILYSGGVAGFPMPTLRYFVGERQQLKKVTRHSSILLSSPKSQQILMIEQLKFSWFDLKTSAGTSIYQIEFYEKTGDKRLIASAFIKPGVSHYKPAKVLIEKLSTSFIWRVIALDKNGNEISRSQLRELQLDK